MTRLAVLFLLTTVSIYPAQVSNQAAEPPLLMLDEATKTALHDNAQVETSLLDVFKAQQATAELGAARFPKFDAAVLSGIALNPMHFTIPEGAIGNVPGIGPLPAENEDFSVARHVTALIHVSAVQPLTQLHKIGLGMHESRIGEAIAQENLRLKRQQTVEQVRDAYGELAETQAQLDAAEGSLRAFTELEQLTKRRLAEESVLKSDLLAVKAGASKARYQVTVLRNGLRRWNPFLIRHDQCDLLGNGFGHARDVCFEGRFLIGNPARGGPTARVPTPVIAAAPGFLPLAKSS